MSHELRRRLALSRNSHDRDAVRRGDAIEIPAADGQAISARITAPARPGLAVLRSRIFNIQRDVINAQIFRVITFGVSQQKTVSVIIDVI